jgi:hypothetical protein
MAELRIDEGQISVRLSLAEKIGALHKDLQFPRAAVRTVRVVDNPFGEIGGMRLPGTRVPGVMALGTWRRRKGWDFVAVYRGQRGIVVEVDANQAAYQRIILSAKDPDGIRDQLAADAGRSGRSPRG